MTDDILSDLFYGNLRPYEKRLDRNTAFAEKAAKLVREEETLRAMLSEAGLEQLNITAQISGELSDLTAQAYFTDGFRTGFRLAQAVLYEEQKPPLKNG